MDNHTETPEQRLKGIEARLTALEAASRKLDRLVYKLFKRLPRPAREEQPSTSENEA
jgi:hypothetical protein